MNNPFDAHPSGMTEQVRAALAAGSPTALLKVLVEAFPGSWFFTRADATFAFVNQTACDTLGYTREELMALSLFDIDPNITPEIWHSLLARAPFTPAPIRTLHRRKDGTVFPVEAYGSQLILGGDRFTVSYVIDLSEEAQTRKALAEKQHLLQSLLDNAPVIVWFVDLDGRFQLAEGSALSLLGLVPADTVGQPVAEVFTALPEIVRSTERALQGHPEEGIVATAEREFEYRYRPRRNDADAVIGATGVAMDITARRRAERANWRLMTAFEQSDESVLLLDREGRVEYANAAFALISGVAKEGMAGLSWPALLPPLAGNDRAREEIAQALREGTTWRGTIRWRNPADDERILQASLSPLRDASGTHTGFVASSRDITLQTRTEDRLRQVEKMDAVGQLAGGVAHDFNNLLQVVQGNADLALALDPPEPLHPLLKEIKNASQRAAALVKQLLAFSKNVGEPRTVALDTLIHRMVPLLRRMLGEHIQVDAGPFDGTYAIWGDESQMEQIVLNLCVNARDAMPRGGRLSLQLGHHQVGPDNLAILGLPSPGDYIALNVSDTGCGMTEEIRRRIFEPFFTTKAPGVGTGLGLATVYAVAKRHGGSIEAWSQVDRGSRFQVLLPRAKIQETAARPRESAPASMKTRLRILLAEDDPSVRKITLRFLELAGHEVVTAMDGAEAVARICAEAPTYDLLVLDAIMPNVNGPEVYKTFRALSAAPVLFVTGHDFNVLEALPEDPARGILHKPFRASDLAAVIAQLLG